MNLLSAYLRWRHTKGYGVHSPYAYRLVKDVFRPGPYSYYACENIDKLLDAQEFSDKRMSCEIKFLIRLIIFLRAKRIVALGDASRPAEIACCSLDKEFWSYNDKNDRNSGGTKSDEFDKDVLLVTGRDFKDISVIEHATKEGASIYAVDPPVEVKEFLTKPLDRGLLMKGLRRMLLIPRQEMAYLSYDIRF